MDTNLEYFDYAKNNPEELLDPFYAKGVLVIPPTKEVSNLLTKNNEKLLKFITAFNVLDECYKKNQNDETVQKIVADVIDILDNTPNINYSAFSQFFMVYNSNYSVYKSQNMDNKKTLVYEMLKKYCAERHNLYLSHGYSNVILQVMSDNYSHKRNSKSGIEKILSILDPYGLDKLDKKEDILTNNNFYFLPDKGGEDIFEYMLQTLKIKMESRTIEHDKFPDIVFKHNDQYYICELKTMKQGGGGQNKQIVEVAHFIRFSEKNPNIHYITFLDCNYSNIIFQDISPKITSQRNDIMSVLRTNPKNYFLNTKAMIKFTQDLFVDKK